MRPQITLFSARVPSWSVRWADLIAGLITDLNAICAICRSYIGHTWAIHRLHINHVQPTVQATDGPYPISRKWGWQRRSRHPPFSLNFLWSICGPYCRLYMAYVQLMYGTYMAHVWTTYGTYRVQICDQFCDQICSRRRSPGNSGKKKCDLLPHRTASLKIAMGRGVGRGRVWSKKNCLPVFIQISGYNEQIGLKGRWR